MERKQSIEKTIIFFPTCVVDGHSCVSAYWDTVSCVLNITGDSLGPSNTTYNLTFTQLGKQLQVLNFLNYVLLMHTKSSFKMC